MIKKVKSQKYNDNMVLWFLMYKDKRKYQMKLGMKLLFFIRWRKIVKKKHFCCYNHGFRTLDTNVTHTKLNIGTCFSTSIIWQ